MPKLFGVLIDKHRKQPLSNRTTHRLAICAVMKLQHLQSCTFDQECSSARREPSIMGLALSGKTSTLIEFLFSSPREDAARHVRGKHPDESPVILVGPLD